MIQIKNKQYLMINSDKKSFEFDILLTITIMGFILLLFTTIQLLAQEKNKKDLTNDRPRRHKTETATIPNSTQATGDTVSVKDDAGNVLMTVTDEGSAGSIKLENAGAVSPNTNKLYNNGGNLYWNGSALSTGSGGATEINELSDARTTPNSVFLGNNAGSTSSGFGNTAVGVSAMNSITSSAQENVAFGNSALSLNSSGDFNTAIGQAALKNNTSGSNNTAIGEDALYKNLTGSGNVAIGMEAGRNELGSNKLYINNDSSSSPLIWGDFANDIAAINGKLGVGTMNPSDKVEIIAASSGEVGLRVKIGTATKFKVEENGGVAIGANYGNTPANGLYVNGKTKLTTLQVTTGASDGYILTSDANGNASWQVSASGGATELNDLNDSKTTGSSLYLGSTAGTYDDGGDNSNTGLGIGSLTSNSLSASNGQRNSAVGYFSLNANHSGHSNTAQGYYSLSNNGTGDFNTAIGRSTASFNTTGEKNVAIGAWANLLNNSGSNNTMIGYEAGRGVGSTGRPVSGNIFIGYQAGGNETTDNKLFIENSNSSTPLIWGDFDSDSVKINGNLNVSGNITTDITYSVGDYAQGGYVFEVTPNGKHGLVIALKDQISMSNQWYKAQEECSNASAHTSQGANYKNWRLPTQRELTLIFANKSAIDAMASSHDGVPFDDTGNTYWSSTTDWNNLTNAFCMNMSSGALVSIPKQDPNKSTRSVRAF